VERVDAIVDLAPEACRHCARRLHARHSVGDPRRHQVTELPLSTLDLATTPTAKRFRREALALDRRLFRLWHHLRGDPGVRGAPLTRAELITKVLPSEKRLFALGEQYLDAANADVRNLAHAFFVHNQHFFTFVHEEGVEPTNNSAERALRTAVQWRKIMFGTRSDQGERAVERLLTIVRTCQLQQLNELAYLTAAVAAHRRRQAVASLLTRFHTPELLPGFTEDPLSDRAHTYSLSSTARRQSPLSSLPAALGRSWAGFQPLIWRRNSLEAGADIHITTASGLNH